MPRLLRRCLYLWLLGCIAFAFAFLFLHVAEPLRLNVGDPWADADVLSSVESVRQHGFTIDPVDVDLLIASKYRPTHYPPLAEIAYGVIGKLGGSDIGALRLFALALSVLAMWLLFQWARRIWNETVALLATALFSTSVLWMMYADSIYRPAGVHVSCLLALWGLVRTIETSKRRHAAAAIAGSFACVLAGFGDWVFLLAGVLFTVYIKLGNPFARGNRRFVLICAAGCLAAVVLRSVLDIGPVDWQPGTIEWRSSIDHKLEAALATLLRRCTLAFTPMFWITLGYMAWRAARAPSLTSVLQDGTTWLAVVAAIVFYRSLHYTGSPLLRAQPLLPLYAIGSAILIARLLEQSRIRRALAIAWIAVAPVWGLRVMVSHPRSVLDRDDVARARAYLATNDRNEFVMSNLMSDGPIQAAFDRLSWPALEMDDEIDPHRARLQMLDVFETTGTGSVHAVIFTTPDSRFVDRSLALLLRQRRLASVTGWPYMVRGKANEIVHDYDRRVLNALAAIGAKKVLHLSNFDVYRVDRPTVLEVARASVPLVREINFSSYASNNHKLLGWGQPKLTDEEQLGVSSIYGLESCRNSVEPRAGAPVSQLCGTVLAASGLQVLDRGFVDRAQLMIRVERACDLRLTLDLASPSRVPLITGVARLISQLSGVPVTLTPSALLKISMQDFAVWECEPGDRVSFLVPQRSVQPGVNILTLEKKPFGPLAARADVMSLAIEPLCDSAR